MECIKKIWSEQVAQNPIENVLLEINLGTKLDKNLISYELTGSKFNEILADLALLKVWTDWKSGYSTKYFLNDMVMILDESGHSRVSINKTIYQKFLNLSLKKEKEEEEEEEGGKEREKSICGRRYLDQLPRITEIRVHKDDIKSNNEEILEDVRSNLHIKCCRKIPLGIVQFPPYDKFHAIERIAYRYYRNTNITVNFIISRPRDCLRTFDELLVNWQNSRFMIKVVVIKPDAVFEAILKYLGHE